MPDDFCQSWWMNIILILLCIPGWVLQVVTIQEIGPIDVLPELVLSMSIVFLLTLFGQKFLW